MTNQSISSVTPKVNLLPRGLRQKQRQNFVLLGWQKLCLPSDRKQMWRVQANKACPIIKCLFLRQQRDSVRRPFQAVSQRSIPSRLPRPTRWAQLGLIDLGLKLTLPLTPRFDPGSPARERRRSLFQSKGTRDMSTPAPGSEAKWECPGRAGAGLRSGAIWGHEALRLPLLAGLRITRASRVTGPRTGPGSSVPRSPALSLSHSSRKETKVIWVVPLPQHQAQPRPKVQSQAVCNQPPCWDARSF